MNKLYAFEIQDGRWLVRKKSLLHLSYYPPPQKKEKKCRPSGFIVLKFGMRTVIAILCGLITMFMKKGLSCMPSWLLHEHSKVVFLTLKRHEKVWVRSRFKKVTVDSFAYYIDQFLLSPLLWFSFLLFHRHPNPKNGTDFVDTCTL